MGKHTTYRGVTMDMDMIRRENEQVTAVGNAGMNARGDKISGGQIIRTADEIARDNNRVKSAIISTGLKGEMPKSVEAELPKQQTKQQPKKTKEVELPSGDIVVDEDKD